MSIRRFPGLLFLTFSFAFPPILAQAQFDTTFISLRGDTLPGRAGSHFYTINIPDQNQRGGYTIRRAMTRTNQVLNEYPVVMGNYHGLARKWDSTGRLIYSCQYKEGKQEGYLHTYYPNGKKRRQEQYLHGDRGWKACFDSTGKEIPFFEYLTPPSPPLGVLANLPRKIRYPARLRKSYVSGNALVFVTIGKDGSIRDVQLKKEVHSELDAEIFEAFSTLNQAWTPARRENAPIESTIAFLVRFDLDLPEPYMAILGYAYPLW